MNRMSSLNVNLMCSVFLCFQIFIFLSVFSVGDIQAKNTPWLILPVQGVIYFSFFFQCNLIPKQSETTYIMLQVNTFRQLYFVLFHFSCKKSLFYCTRKIENKTNKQLWFTSSYRNPKQCHDTTFFLLLLSIWQKNR